MSNIIRPVTHWTLTTILQKGRRQLTTFNHTSSGWSHLTVLCIQDLVVSLKLPLGIHFTDEKIEARDVRSFAQTPQGDKIQGDGLGLTSSKVCYISQFSDWLTPGAGVSSVGHSKKWSFANGLPLYWSFGRWAAFAKQNESKPRETKIMSSWAGMIAQ